MRGKLNWRLRNRFLYIYVVFTFNWIRKTCGGYKNYYQWLKLVVIKAPSNFSEMVNGHFNSYWFGGGLNTLTFFKNIFVLICWPFFLVFSNYLILRNYIHKLIYFIKLPFLNRFLWPKKRKLFLILMQLYFLAVRWVHCFTIQMGGNTRPPYSTRASVIQNFFFTALFYLLKKLFITFFNAVAKNVY